MPDDWWTALQFDRAVTYLGRHIENKLQETETQNGKLIYLHTLEDLLKDAPVQDKNATSIEKYDRMGGVIHVG